MNRKAYAFYVDGLGWRAANLPTKPAFETVNDKAAFDAAMKTMPPGWKCKTYALHSGKVEGVAFGPKLKMTLTLDAANTVKRIAMNRCDLDPDAAAGLALRCDVAAAHYSETVRRFGRWPDRRALRDEMQRLRAAVKISETAKDALMHAAAKRWAQMRLTPGAAMSPYLGKGAFLPGTMLAEIGAYCDTMLAMLDADERPQGGRPEPIRARQLIRELAVTFKAFTGKRCTATPGTPFYEIVRQVLLSLGLPGNEPRKMIQAALADPTGACDKVL